MIGIGCGFPQNGSSSGLKQLNWGGCGQLPAADGFVQ
ncbi:hypothetical protein ETH_00035710, partial [Eimeria tenella]